MATEALRDVARWLYQQHRQEYEHRTPDATIDEAIEVNGWTFQTEGKRFG